MSFNVGELVGYLKLDTSPWGESVRKAQNDARRMMDATGRDMEAGGKKAGTMFAGSLNTAVKAGAGILAATFAVDKIVTYFRGSIDAAGESAAAVKRSTVVFGENSAAVQAWAATAARNFGLSSRAALSSAASFGDMFTQLGFGGTQAAAMSERVVALAADLGAFKGLGTEDVLERIAAGFRGEYDSLQLLVPTISAATVEQQALTDTGKKSASALTAQEKAAATLAVVVKGAANATGFYAKNVDDKAQAERTAAASAEDLAVKVGTMLLPAYTALVKFGRDSVIPFLSGTVDAIAAAGTAIDPLVSGLMGLVGVFRELPGPLQGAIIGMVAFIAFRDKFTAFGQSVHTGLSTARGTVQSFGEAMHYAGQASERAGGGVAGFAAGARTFTGAAGLMKGAASGLLGVMGGPWGAAFTGATALVGLWAQKQVEAKARVQALSDSLDKQTGAITDNTRAVLAKEMADNGAFDTARELGLSLDTVTDAALGNADAMKVLNDRVADFYAAQDAGDISDASYANLLQTIKDYSAEIDIARSKTGMVAEAMGEAGGAADSYAEKTKGAAEETMSLKQAQDLLAGNIGSLMEAENRYAESISRTDEAIKENGRTLDVHTEKGRANRQALLDEAAAAVSAAEAALKHGDSVESVSVSMDTAQAAFVRHAVSMGMDATKASALAKELGISRGKVDELSTAVRNTPEGKAIKITADTSDAMARIAALRSTLQSLAGQVSVAAKYAGMDKYSANAHGSIRLDGVRKMAFGDVTRNAMIMARKSPILWNEAPGGESYIPLAPDKRARSLRIWQRTGELLGVGSGQSAPSISPADIRAALDGMRIDLGRVDPITHHVTGELVAAYRGA